MAVNTYDIGDQVRITATFKNRSGTATDPTGIVFKYQEPGEAVTTITYPTTIIKDDTGVYHIDLTVTSAGNWTYRWEATGALIAAEEGRLEVKVSDLA